MTQKTNDHRKLNLLSKLQPFIDPILEFTDPEGKNFPAYEVGNKAMDTLYNIIEGEY